MAVAASTYRSCVVGFDQGILRGVYLALSRRKAQQLYPTTVSQPKSHALINAITKYPATEITN